MKKELQEKVPCFSEPYCFSLILRNPRGLFPLSLKPPYFFLPLMDLYAGKVRKMRNNAQSGQGPLRREPRRDFSLNVPYTKGQKMMGNSPSKGAISRIGTVVNI